MLALLSTLVFAAAAAFAAVVVFVTISGRRGQITKLLADYRSLQQDREFLVYVTSFERPAPRVFGDQNVRRTARRTLKRSELARSARLHRVAA
jgi:hypothetical protein